MTTLVSPQFLFDDDNDDGDDEGEATAAAAEAASEAQRSSRPPATKSVGGRARRVSLVAFSIIVVVLPGEKLESATERSLPLSSIAEALFLTVASRSERE